MRNYGLSPKFGVNMTYPSDWTFVPKRRILGLESLITRGTPLGFAAIGTEIKHRYDSVGYILVPCIET